jgi:hypothetical protein
VTLYNLVDDCVLSLLAILVIQQFIVMHSRDNCATALTTFSKETVIRYSDRVVRLNHEIGIGHEFAITCILSDALIIKYGQTIGRATQDIAPGDWIHVHKIRSVYMETFTDAR